MENLEIGSKADSEQSRGDTCLSSCFHGAACALLPWVSRADVCVCEHMCQSVCEFVKRYGHSWLKRLGTSQTGFTFPFYSAQG